MNYENYDPCFPDQSVVDLYLPIWANLPAFRRKPAFIWAEDAPSCMTYEQLNSTVGSISSTLLQRLRKGDTVLILCAPGLDVVKVIFACQRAGLVAVPITPPHLSFTGEKHHHLVRVLSQAKPRAAVADLSYINLVKEYASSTSADKRMSDLLQLLDWIPMEELKAPNKSAHAHGTRGNSSRYDGCRAEDVYLIQYTSGATGIPKPVLVTAGSAAHNVRTARKAYDFHPNSVVVSWLPQYHDCGLMFLLLTVISGATCVLTSPGAFVNRPRLWLELISDYKATCTPVPSFTLPLVIRRGGADKGTSPINLESMKNLIIINEPIYKSSIDEFVQIFATFGLKAACISPSYGLAENCTFVSTSWRRGHDGNFPTYKSLVPSARLSAVRWDDETEEQDMDIQILVMNEETHEPVQDGTEGEIWISSPSNASGYLDHPSLTRSVFKARINSKVAGCFTRTGDRGIVIGNERYLFVTGRCYDMVKLEDGREIHPHYIETAAYNSCPEVLRGGCIAAFEVSKRIVVIAELQKSGGMDLVASKKTCEAIREEVIEEEGIEVGLVILVKSGSVPKTSSGKIQRWAAKNKLVGGGFEVIMQMEFVSNGFKTGMMMQGMRRKKLMVEDSGTHISLLSAL